MDGSKDKDETPLLVVRYVWWRLLWRLFFPYVPGIFVFYGSGGYFVKQENPIAYIAMYAFMLLYLGMTINLLLMRGIQLYKDRIEWQWFILGTWILRYDEVMVILTYTNMKVFNFRTIQFSKKLRYIYQNIRIDRNLISKKTEEKIVGFLIFRTGIFRSFRRMYRWIRLSNSKEARVQCFNP